VLIGSFPTRPVFTILATVGIILAALYVLLMYQRTMHGPPRGVLLAEDPEGVAVSGGARRRRRGCGRARRDGGGGGLGAHAGGPPHP
jgi:NADH-quinone oxidoreductase subunit M